MSEPPALPRPPSSPRWGASTKLAISLALIALMVISLIYFRSILGPVLLAFILAFFFHPLVARLSATLKTSWRASVGILYLLLVLVVLGIFTASGIAIVQQVQSLVEFVNRFITDLPGLVEDWSTRTIEIGPFALSFSQFDFSSLVDQVLNTLRPLLGQAGSVVSTVAAGAANVVGWGFFVLLISYYLLAEGGQLRENLVHIELPGYSDDMRRLARELGQTWDAFLRGQLVISLMTMAIYYVLLTSLGLRFSLAIAILAGLARFVPWVGPFVAWTTTALVAFLQPENYFQLAAWKYMLLIIAVCMGFDQVLDYFIVPRLLGKTLGVHPAGVLIAAIIATNLLGFVGLVLAAPVYATAQLTGRYVLRKLFDLDPWPEPERPPPLPELPGRQLFRRLKAWWRLRQRRR